MEAILKCLSLILIFILCSASYHEQYRGIRRNNTEHLDISFKCGLRRSCLVASDTTQSCRFGVHKISTFSTGAAYQTSVHITEKLTGNILPSPLVDSKVPCLPDAVNAWKMTCPNTFLPANPSSQKKWNEPLCILVRNYFISTNIAERARLLAVGEWESGLRLQALPSPNIVPQWSSEKWESYTLNDKEFIVQNLPVNWENAKILCRGYHNGSLAILDTRDKAEFLAEALSESQFYFTSLWVGARRDSAEDAAGYRWGQGVELRRTALDVLASEREENTARHYPVWLNRTHVPVPETGADCVALERVNHDNPVFLDLPCHLERAFACERDAQSVTHVTEVKTVRCRGGLYHMYDGRVDWHQAAAYCVLRGMNLANIATLKCLRRLGLAMLKNRPSIENAWVGAKGTLGRWSWIDSGVNLFQTPAFTDAAPETWPPMRDRSNIKQNGCLQLDRHESHPAVFLEARCERKMQFICYEGVPSLKSTVTTPSDDLYYYVLVRQHYYWQHAYENCLRMNGTLANLDNNDVLIQLLLVMGENREQPIEHIWISGRLNMTKDILTGTVNYGWYNPTTMKHIPDPKAVGDSTPGSFMLPWLDEEFTMDSSCLNLDRQDHLIGLVYGLPCDTPQYSVCMIEKPVKLATASVEPVGTGSTAPAVSDGYESS